MSLPIVIDQINKRVKKAGDTMSGTLLMDGIATGNFTEGIRINQATDGWSLVQLGGSVGATQGSESNSWLLGTDPDGQFRLTRYGSTISNDSSGQLETTSDGAWVFYNQLWVRDVRDANASSCIAACKPDGTTSLNLFYNPDGWRGLWDGVVGTTPLALDASNNLVTQMPLHFPVASANIHMVNGTYQSDSTLRYANSGIEIRENGLVGTAQTDIGYAPSIGFHWGGRWAGTLCMSYNGILQWLDQDGNGATFSAGQVWGAVWNDYAEYRSQTEKIEPGYCVISLKSGKVSKTNKRLSPCDGIVSDTFGFAIGETDNCQTPLAVAGRVLAYPGENRNFYEIGDPVCAGENGCIYRMTREEVREWPDRIVGTISEIPEYETWGSGNVAVNGRVWIKCK